MTEFASVNTDASDKKATSALITAQGLHIASAEDYAKADAYCKGLNSLRKEIEADFAPSIEKAKAAKKAAADALSALVEQMESHTEPVHEAERILKGKLDEWETIEEEKRRLAQEHARLLAHKAAEDTKLAKAAALEKQGKTAAAEAELSAPVKVAPVVLPPSAMARETTITKYWAYTITAPAAVKRDFCKPDPGVIQSSMNAYKRQGKSMAEVEERIGGIKIEERIK